MTYQNNTQDIKNKIDPLAFYCREIGTVGTGFFTGNNWYRLKGLCPFHNDTKPGSFHFHAKTGNFHCFACGEKGDVISFYMKKYNVDFKTALKELNERF